MNITFATHDNFVAFQNMAENLWLNYRDDNQEPEFSIVDRLIDELNSKWNSAIDRTTTDQAQYPLTLPLSAGTTEMAESVLENALEYTRDDYQPDDEEPVIREGEVTIS